MASGILCRSDLVSSSRIGNRNMIQSSSVATELDIVERLRLNSEMLKDGHQNNLTELWHSETVKDAAADALEAALEIERLRGLAQELEELREELESAKAQLTIAKHSNGFQLLSNEPAQSPRSKIDREQIAAVLYVTRYPNKIWMTASGLETSVAYKQADIIIRTISSTEWQLNTEMMEKSVAQAIWRAHKDNYNLRMHQVYPLMARAAIEAMWAIRLHPPECRGINGYAQSPSWECMARKQALPEPADCNWPDCGCDPHATNVIESLLEQGWTAPTLSSTDGGSK